MMCVTMSVAMDYFTQRDTISVAMDYFTLCGVECNEHVFCLNKLMQLYQRPHEVLS